MILYRLTYYSGDKKKKLSVNNNTKITVSGVFYYNGFLYFS